MQSLDWRKSQTGVEPLVESMDESSRSWANLLACGALTPGLLSMLALAAGFSGAMMPSASAAPAPTRIAAGETAGPQVAILSPVHSDQLRGKEQIRVSIPTKGRRYPAQWIDLQVDDNPAVKGGPVRLDASMLPTAIFEWDTRLFADGPHRLSVIVTDSQGFKGRSEVQVYINNRGDVDVVPPTIRWLNVRNGDVLRGEHQVQIEAKDNFGVKWIIVSLNLAISPAQKPPLRGAFLNVPPYIYRLDTRGLLPNRYVLNAEVYDARDNRGVADPVEVWIGPRINPAIGTTPSIPSPTAPLPQTGNPSDGGAETGTPDNTGQSGIGTRGVPGTGNTNPNGGAQGSSETPVVTVPGGNDVNPTVQQAPTNPAPANPNPQQTGGTQPANPTIAGNPANPPGNSGNPSPRALPRVTMKEGASGASTILPGEYPLDRAQRTPSAPRVAAVQPHGEMRSVPGVGQMTHVSPLTESAPLTNEVPVTKRAPREARLNGPSAAVPSGYMRPMPQSGKVATPPVANPAASNEIAANTSKAVAASPLLSSGNKPLAESSVARGAARVNKAPASAMVVASVPSGTPRALPQSAPAPQASKVPQLSQPAVSPSSGIARPFPEAKARPSLAPSLAVMPAAVRIYPELPSPNLTPSLTQRSSLMPASPLVATMPVPGKSGLAQPALPPAMPRMLPTIPSPHLAMAQPMPKTGVARSLEAITVAPAAQWGTKAEALPTTHVVRRDETLSAIAKRYEMPVAVLAAANNLKANSRLTSGAKLTLPRALRVTFGGQTVKTDASSFLMGSVGVTPFRFLFEKQGGKLDWDAKNRRVTAHGVNDKISLTIGSRTATVNEKETLMDLAAFLMSGRTMVPVRFFEQALHAQVEWDPATGRLYVATSSVDSTKG